MTEVFRRNVRRAEDEAMSRSVKRGAMLQRICLAAVAIGLLVWFATRH